MLCPDSDSRKGLFCVLPKAIDSVAGFGLAKAEPDSAKKPPLHKLFTNTFDPSSNCPDLNSRDTEPAIRHIASPSTDKDKQDPSPLLSGFEPTKVPNLIVISLFSGLSAFGVVLCVVTGGDENEKDDRRIMERRDQPTGHPDFR